MSSGMAAQWRGGRKKADRRPPRQEQGQAQLLLSGNEAALEGACCSQHRWPERDLCHSGRLRKGPEEL